MILTLFILFLFTFILDYSYTKYILKKEKIITNEEYKNKRKEIFHRRFYTDNTFRILSILLICLYLCIILLSIFLVLLFFCTI